MSITEKKRAWQEGLVQKTLAKAPERRETFTTGSGIEVDRCATPTYDYPGYDEKLAVDLAIGLVEPANEAALRHHAL